MGPPFVLGTRGQDAQTDHHLHVDNIGIVSDHVSQAHLAVDESKKEFEKDRLMHHEIAASADAGRALGLELNVEQLRTLRTVERFGQIRKGLRCSLTWVRVAGGELDALTGHVTFMGFLRRETLSPFHCVYRLARRLHHRRGPLWASARAELVAFTGVVVFIEAGWARPRMAGVLASDASPCGFGVAQSFWDISDVATVSRVPEVRRWRCGAVPAGRHAFESSGFRVGSCSGEVLSDGFGRTVSLDPELEEIIASGRGETDSNFREIPSHLLSSQSWKKVVADRWFFR